MAAIPQTAVNMSQAKETFNRLSLTNYFLVSVGLTKQVTDYVKKELGVDYSKFNSKLGLLCHEASLPTSSYATAEVKDNFMGVSQEYAHTRMYSDLDFSFYVDDNYTVLKVFEGWMDYVSGAGPSQHMSNVKGYYRRMNWPDDYKTDNLYITKFERNIRTQAQYQFINAFPKSVTSIPVSYGGADISKISVSFNFDRYILNRKKISLNANGNENNSQDAGWQAYNDGLDNNINYSWFDGDSYTDSGWMNWGDSGDLKFDGDFIDIDNFGVGDVRKNLSLYSDIFQSSTGNYSNLGGEEPLW